MPTWTLIGAPTSRCEPPVVPDDLIRAEAGAARAHREQEQAVARREVLVAHAPDVLGELSVLVYHQSARLVFGFP